MRTTYHNGRGKARHNDREFIREGTDTPANIDANRCYGIWTYQMGFLDLNDGDELCINLDFEWTGSLRDVELEYYKTHYEDALATRNANYKKTGHAERQKTIEEWYDKMYPPEETIIQIGTMFDIGDTDDEQEDFAENFSSCVDEFVKWHEQWNQEHGNHVHLLSVALHLDESTPHVHIRRVYDYTDKNGNLTIGTDKALEAAGVDIANPEKPPKKNAEKRFNNRKMTFDKMMREKWNQICDDWGFEIEHTPVTGRRSLTLTEYVRKQEAERCEKTKQLEAKTKQITDLEAFIETQQSVFNKSKKRIEEQLSKRENEIIERENKIARREEICAIREQNLTMREHEFNNNEQRIKEIQNKEIKRLENLPDVQPETSFEKWVINKKFTIENKPLFQFYQEDIKNQRIDREKAKQQKYKNEYEGAADRVLQKAAQMQNEQQDYYNYYGY